jgi:hypothetical protein
MADDEVFKLVKQLGLEESVRFTGYVEDEDLPAIYSVLRCSHTLRCMKASGFRRWKQWPAESRSSQATHRACPKLWRMPGERGTARCSSLAQELIRLLDDAAKRDHFSGSPGESSDVQLGACGKRNAGGLR